MTPGEIGAEAGRIFEYNLPSNWIFRSQEDQNDHGIDGEIEVKNSNGMAQGKEFVFKVQIKGEETSNYIDNGKKLSFNIKTSKLKYYLSFNIPVILVVVETSSEKIYWTSITDNEELASKIYNVKTDSIQIHLPVENTIKRRDDALTKNLLSSVFNSWDYLAIKGVKSSIRRFSDLEPERLEHRISTMGDALYKAHHQMLENHLSRGDFTKVYKVSSDMLQSRIVPAADRFVAGLFYRTVLRIAPLHEQIVDQMREMFNISVMLIQLAHEEKSENLRRYSIGLARSAKLKYEIESLYSNHNASKAFSSDSPESFIFRSEIHKQYSRVCFSLKKIIDSLSLIANKFQYHIFCEVYFESAVSLFLFRAIQKERGSEESIDFFKTWLTSTFQFCISYLFITEAPERAKRLYSIALHTDLHSPEEREALKVNLASISPTAIKTLNAAEKNHSPIIERDFLTISTEEQMKYFKDTARNMGMDPDDINSEMGQVVSMALKNYDPTEILSNCEHLFVHYRPGGIIAQTLQMHSAGGMHLLVCLKHQHIQGTGNLLKNIYFSPPNIPMRGFQKSYCESCSDCSPRPPGWKWSLAWQRTETTKHIAFLDLFKNW